jgi:WD40 repeat protein
MNEQDALAYKEFRKFDFGAGFSDPRVFVRFGVFSKDEKYIICGCGVGLIRYEIATGNIIRSTSCNRVDEMDISSDGTLIVSAFMATVIVWRIEGLEPFICFVLTGINNNINAVKLIQLGSITSQYFILTASRNPVVKMWNFKHECVREFTSHKSPVYDISVFSCINRFASFDDIGSIKFWNSENGDLLGTMHVSIGGHCRSIAVTKNGLNIAVVTRGGIIDLCTTTTHRVIRHFKHRDSESPVLNSVNLIKFNHDDSLIASVGYDCTAKIFQVASGECLQKFTMTEDIQSVFFSANSDKLVLIAGGFRRSMHVYSPLHTLIPNFYFFQTWTTLSQKKTAHRMPRDAIRLIGVYMFKSTLSKPT